MSLVSRSCLDAGDDPCVYTDPTGKVALCVLEQLNPIPPSLGDLLFGAVSSTTLGVFLISVGIKSLVAGFATIPLGLVAVAGGVLLAYIFYQQMRKTC
jgi:hypothetical protein